MQVITTFNEKGGVGKTTLTGLIGAGLALKGHRVLLIDADGQGDLSTNMRVRKTSSFYDFVKRYNAQDDNHVPLKNLIQRVPEDSAPENLYIIAGNNESWGIPNSTNMIEIVRGLSTRFAELQKIFAYVLIDTQPSATTLHDGIGLVTDWFICPTDAEPLSAFGGLKSTVSHIGYIREQSQARGRDKAKLLGIIPNKFRTQTSLHQAVYSELVEQYGDTVFDPLPLRTTIPESQLRRETLLHVAPELETNDHIWSIVNRIEATTQGESLNG